MDQAGDRITDPEQRVCVCGKTFSIPIGALPGELLTCPHCGSAIPHSTDDTSLAETQMINVREMARMAQEGLSKPASGNLRAVDPRGAKKRSDCEP